VEPSIFNHRYHEALVYKVMNACKPDRVYRTFEQTLDIIRLTHRLTRGVPQIVYLTGWQYDGHDSKYPAWFEVNPRLARAGEAPQDSLLWLMREAREKYNAVVSVHINMCDAYQNSPLWEEYVQADVLSKDEEGQILRGGIWDGEQAYGICKSREWASGLARRRIDQILAMLPLAEAGTVHIDVFGIHVSPFHGTTPETEVAVMKEIIGYWNSRGVDVTTEYSQHEFVGLVPYFFHFNFDEASRLRYPAALVCGGGSAWNKRAVKAERPIFNCEGGCLYEEAWGQSVDLEPCYLDQHPFEEFISDFYLKTLPFLFLNRHRVEEHIHTAEQYRVRFSDGVETSVRKFDRDFQLTHRGRLLVQGSDVFLPLFWRDRECIAFSRRGGEHIWTLPPDWRDVSHVAVTTLTDAPEFMDAEPAETVVRVLAGSRIRLFLMPRQAVAVSPAIVSAAEVGWTT